MTNKELIRELRKPGKVEMPVNTAHDTYHIVIDKSDLIAQLINQPQDEQAGWVFMDLTFDNGGVRRLDIA